MPSNHHHFVPVFYLKQWADAQGKVIEYSRKNGAVLDKRVGPKATGFEPGLNSFPELPPELAEFLEDEFLQTADDDAATALRILLAGEFHRLDTRLKSGWSRFLIGMRMRHPDAMKELRDISLRMWRTSNPSTQAEYEKHRIDSDPATLEELAAIADPLIEPKVQIRLIARAMDNEQIGRRINSARWEILDLSSAPHRLLTSDRPLDIFQFQTDNGLLATPISPTKLFVATHRDPILGVLKRHSPNEIVRQMNQFIVKRARRYAYASSLAQDKFIKANMSATMEGTPFFPTMAEQPESEPLFS